MERDSLIYWAGFMDGEGHIALTFTNPKKDTGHGAYSFGVWINQWLENPKEFFGELLEAFGGRIIAMKNQPNTYRWYILGGNGRQFLQALLPYLRVKRRQAELGIQFQLRQAEWPRWHRLTMGEITERDRILREYNKLIRVSRAQRVIRYGQHDYSTGGRKR